MTILEKIALALPAVESPARYMGGEANSVVKDHSQMLARMAFVFPDPTRRYAISRLWA